MITFHGIDFSGGEHHSGKIWVATRDGRSVSLRRGFDHRAIVEMIAASAADGRDHLWRIDAPFGVPREVLSLFDIDLRWESMAAWLATFPDARAWRNECRTLARNEPRRTTDREAHTPMAPQNLRVFKQTWSVITRVLAPLADRGMRIEPVAGPRESRVVVAEGCPASVLHSRGWSVRGYKGAGEPPRERRSELLRLYRRSGAELDDALAKRAIDDEEGDGIDALLLTLDPVQTVVPAEGFIEAWVY